MSSICLALQVHLPCRLRHYSFFDIGGPSVYEDDVKTLELLNQAATGHILPVNRILAKLLEDYPDDFQVAFSLSGSTLDQFERFRPDVLESFQKLASTGSVEFICAPYHHSVASLLSLQEFREQALLHRAKLQSLFGQPPTTFQNTGLIYNDTVAQEVESLGFDVILAGGDRKLLTRHNANHLCHPAPCTTLKLLVNHSAIAQEPTSWELWKQIRAKVIPVFLDIPVALEPSQGGSRILDFLRLLPETLLKDKDFKFQTPSTAARTHKTSSRIHSPDWVSNAAPRNDLSPWMENEMQKDALNALYLLEPTVKSRPDEFPLKTWRMLQMSDHFSRMNTRRDAGINAPADVMPYDTPYDAYINFMNVLTDFSERVGK